MKKKINIGLDIGIASVGWAILDSENNDILDLGVRLFKEANSSADEAKGNIKRRNDRLKRRRIRREKLRKEELKKLFIKFGYADNSTEINNILKNDIKENGKTLDSLSLREKAITSKISKKELIKVLFYYIKHRGYFYDDAEPDEKVQKVEVKDLPLQFQKKHAGKFNKIIGIPENISISHKLYQEEIRKIFSNQETDHDFINEYFSLFDRTRDYSVGPGGAKSPTKYGLFRKENGVIVQHGSSLWEELIGKCSVYETENRAPRFSFTSELFNFLNLCNNIRMNNDKNWRATEQQKRELIKRFLEPKSVDPIKFELAYKIKVFQEVFNDQEFDKNSNVIFEKQKATQFEKCFQKTKELIKIFLEFKNMDIYKKVISAYEKQENREIFDRIMNCILITKTKEERTKKINEIGLSKEISQAIVERIKNCSTTHSLSFKAMQEAIPFLITNPENSQHIFYKNKQNNEAKNKTKYLNKNIFNNEILSPVAKRSFIQSITVINAIIKKFSKIYDFENIIIELPREKNSDEATKRISKYNSENKKKKESIVQEFTNIENQKLSTITVKKLLLAKEQDWLDLYDLQPLDRELIVSNPNYCQIDHIIPEAYSFTSKNSNLVVTKSQNNWNKKNRTPKQYLSNEMYQKMAAKAKDIFCSKGMTEKYQNLTFELDPKNETEGFIKRNLVDTSYASRLVLNNFQDFFHNSNTKIKVIKGGATGLLRKKIFENPNPKLWDWKNVMEIPKNRDEFKHHAIDAAIVATFGCNKSNLSKFLEQVQNKELSYEVNDDTGEVKFNDENLESHVQTIKIDDFGKKIRDVNNGKKIKFSYKIMTRENVQIHKETLYSYKQINDKFQKIAKINLLTLNSLDAEKYFGENIKESSAPLCYLHDKELYLALKSIFENYKGEEKSLPFKEFAEKENKICEDSFIIDFIPKREIKIKNIRVLSDYKKQEDILFKKYDTGISKNCGYETFTWKEIHVLKTQKGSFISLPINAKNIMYVDGKQIIDKEKYINQISKLNINTKTKPIILKYGSHLLCKESNELFYVVGATRQVIEIKPISRRTKGQNTIAINVLAKNFNLCEVDAIGNIYNIKSFDI